MKIDWSPVLAEQALWRAEGLVLPVWWRDDDAVDATAPLETLIAVSDAVGLPVHLAVIPKFATAALVDRASGERRVSCSSRAWLGPSQSQSDRRRRRSNSATDVRP